MPTILILAVYFAAVNLIAWLFYGADKHRAVNHEWRIPEASLLLLALIGGSIGSLVGMYGFRHKTKKPLFRFGIPAILVLQLAFLFLLNYRFAVLIQ
ncbi:DUF1294 domain-containing protein [Lachnoclostridium sp. Marseille-P6806]|uniref:DUF1294 domain-containing protein n=1 Tax=Lachnoclostridium sp. Marseille-P6806 TaxID=2364793 RepID=UPI00102FF7F4|nr:DUF1294 domain-containing protein [Lachnoclostridium sp. Marseille-P6806]